ncbi:DNA-binding protein [Salmonella enterica]
MRPATFEAEQIIEAGLALQAEGKRITGFGLRNRTGGGSPARLKQVWDEYQATQTAPSTEPVAELPDEVADAVKGISATLAEQLAKLAAELNDKIIKAAERQVDDITRAAEKQQAETEQELADAAQTVDDLEQKLEAMTADFRKTQELLDNSREREQANLVELAQVRERLAATEDRLKASEAAAEQHRQQQAELQKRLDAAGNKLAEAATHHEAELRDIREQHARNEAAMQKRLDEAGKEAVAEQKKQQTALDQALREAAAARESKAELNGELKSLKEQNRELTALLAGKTEPATAKVKKGARNPA